MNLESLRSLALALIGELEKVYPGALCSLESDEPWKLLCAVRLSAQCTDARVNVVTKELFARFPTLDSLADGDLREIERIVKPCGLYQVKAKNLKDICLLLREKYGGVVPDSMEELLTLPGVGRKTANLILGDVYHKPAVVCDTHCIRISNRFGLIDVTDPVKAETALREILPPEKSNDFCHRLVLFGRDTCTARNPKCASCPLSDVCRMRL
ncbi:MAG: endonuclease III [Clostridia bacterium]|nr:endonuclease III [Clostridia bacterium]